MVVTVPADEPAIVRMSRDLMSRLEEEVSDWPEEATTLAGNLVDAVQFAAEEIARGYASEEREVLRHALSKGLEEMDNTERMLDMASDEQLLSEERHSRLEARVYGLRGLLRHLASEIEKAG